jgi:hypothetical protein
MLWGHIHGKAAACAGDPEVTLPCATCAAGHTAPVLRALCLPCWLLSCRCSILRVPAGHSSGACGDGVAKSPSMLMLPSMQNGCSPCWTSTTPAASRLSSVLDFCTNIHESARTAQGLSFTRARTRSPVTRIAHLSRRRCSQGRSPAESHRAGSHNLSLLRQRGVLEGTSDVLLVTVIVLRLRMPKQKAFKMSYLL